MHLDEFLVAAVVVLAVVAVTVTVSKRIGLGSILGYLVAGIVLGPSGIEVAGAGQDLLHFTELGVVLLLFVIGLEMRPLKLWSMRRMVFGLGTLQVLVTGGVLAGYGILAGDSAKAAIIIGLGLALSSTAFVLQLLNETGEMGTPTGTAGFSILLLQDIAIVPLLMLVPVLAEVDMPGTGGAIWLELLFVIAAVAGVLLIGRYLVPLALARVAAARNRDAFTVISILATLGAALAMEAIGASMALGAFLMGMMLSASPFKHQIEAEIEPFKGFLLALFFVAVGMSIDVDTVLEAGVPLFVNVIALLVLKGLVLAGLALAFGLGREIAIRVAFLLPQSGEFGFVLFGAAIGAGLMSDKDFALVAVVISVSMAATPVLNKLGIRLAASIGGKSAGSASAAPVPAVQESEVVVAGYGRAGRTVCTMLQRAGVPYVAYDIDPGAVAQGTRRGHNVHYGNLNDPNIMRIAGIGRAETVVVAVDDLDTAKRIVTEIRNFSTGTHILARAESTDDLRKLLTHGASQATPPLAEGSIALGAMALLSLDVPQDKVVEISGTLRRDDYAGLDEDAATG